MSVKRKLWSIGGGKGGIGKSVFTLGLGISLANLGQRLILLDADLGGANLHTLMGVRYPPYTLEDFLLKRVSRLEDIVIETGVKGIGLICGADDILGAANPTYAQKVRLLSQIEDLPADLVLLDLGAGTSFNTLDFFNYSPGKICLLTSQATSLQNGYGFIKSSLYRHISREFAKEEELLELLWQTDNKEAEEGVTSLRDILTRLQATNPGLGERLAHLLEEYRLLLVVNMVKKERDLQAALIIREVAASFLGLNPRILGHIAFDLAVEAAVNLMIPFPLDKDYSQAAEDLRALARQVLELASQPVHAPEPVARKAEADLGAGVWNPQWQRLPA
uniref:CobQ/CobB/MinD/ParA nucleotide binding domain-containing protein n=1 Tax=Desulfobacca acetoxidans TaxID=60893 RepID=A0A7V4LC07_9BACT